VEGIEATAWTDMNAKASPFEGLNFVWQPKYESLADPSVWLAAAGQIFFTLSIGMGSINCYASYLKEKHDITLTGATAAWTNEFCEVVLGGTILIPIAVAYLGLDQVREITQKGSGFGLGFVVFPNLFQNWGWLAPAAGFMWFGLLFFAAITSSLAMGQPIMAFLQTEFKLERNKSAIVFAAMLLPLALPCALLHENAFWGDFDYWAGTFCLVVFALAESVLFAWVFGMQRGWSELMKGAELRIPKVYYYVMGYVTPVFLIAIFMACVFLPKGEPDFDKTHNTYIPDNDGWDDYAVALATGKPPPKWEWSPKGMIGKLMNRDVALSDADQTLPPEQLEAKTNFLQMVRLGRIGSRASMIAAFFGFSLLVHIAWKRRRREGLHTGEEVAK
jgi:hypothetical protein